VIASRRRATVGAAGILIAVLASGALTGCAGHRFEQTPAAVQTPASSLDANSAGTATGSADDLASIGSDLDAADSATKAASGDVSAADQSEATNDSR
jgi:hypothetical protein